MTEINIQAVLLMRMHIFLCTYIKNVNVLGKFLATKTLKVIKQLKENQTEKDKQSCFYIFYRLCLYVELRLVCITRNREKSMANRSIVPLKAFDCTHTLIIMPKICASRSLNGNFECRVHSYIQTIGRMKIFKINSNAVVVTRTRSPNFSGIYFCEFLFCSVQVLVYL